ncbi:TSUP family transporter [Allosphingosinicella deserti]|uniref:Probable membrane transporter protein n=1 Tax=Allosphingosinicella deserti TaxID=2116704 RepID=A0A2P7QEY0_9SPHN|nr:TSUP family transporter [Sphingomonas deserti]PSJ36531.1 hypothetical protein C7I55_26045 [Sphingomonas deserti]
MDLAPDIIAFLIAAAFVAGFIDALAGGGGLITLPALLAAGVPPLAALGTNKLQSSFGTATAFFTFARAGHVDVRRFALPALASFLGSATGAFTVQRIDPSFLAGFIPLLLIAMAIYFLAGPKMRDEDRHTRIGAAGLFLFSAGIGFYDGFFGPGTGSFFTTMLVALAGLGVVRGVAHTKMLNLASNLAGLSAMIVGGHVLWLLGLAMAGASIAGGKAGAHAAMRFGARAVRPLLVCMCLALTVKLLADPANPLRMEIAALLG